MSVAHDFSHTTPPPAKPQLYSVEEARRLNTGTIAELSIRHGGQHPFTRLLGLNQVTVERAEGAYYVTRSGRRILDFFGGFGSQALGHGHPRIREARQRFQEGQRQDVGIPFWSQYVAALSANLAAIAPADLDFVLLAPGASEATGAALRIAKEAQGWRRSRMVYCGPYRGGADLRVGFGDIEAIEAAFADDPEIGVVLLDTIPGSSGLPPAPAGFWTRLRAACDRHGVLWIADEVASAMGRTGRFFAFEHEGVVPDIVVVGGSLGGGKSTIAAMIARRSLCSRSRGAPRSVIFGGLGESAIGAIAALNVVYDEDLIGNSARLGDYLRGRLEVLAGKYPRIVKEVRGRGLMLGIELQDFSTTLPFGFRQIAGTFDERLRGSLAGFLGGLMLRDYGILVGFSEHHRNVIRLEPPLTIGIAEADMFADALDDLLSRGVARIVTDGLRGRN